MRLLLFVSIAAATSNLLGCSVGMALDGADNPDMAVLRPGTSRSVVEREFGRPKSWVPDQRRALYEYTTGESGSAGRAIAHGVGDVLTLGLWEVVGTPVEATQGHDHWHVNVYYTPDSIVERSDDPIKQ